MNRFILFTLLLCLFSADSCKRTPKETAVALSSFKSLESVLQKDGGALWGSAMYAPTFFVHPETKVIYADRKDEQGLLQPLDGIWTGTLPEQMNPANSTAELGGMKWVMAIWPLPESEFERNVLLVHETFHYWQPELGLDSRLGLCNTWRTLLPGYGLRWNGTPWTRPSGKKTPNLLLKLLARLCISGTTACRNSLQKHGSMKTLLSSWKVFPNIPPTSFAAMMQLVWRDKSWRAASVTGTTNRSYMPLPTIRDWHTAIYWTVMMFPGGVS